MTSIKGDLEVRLGLAEVGLAKYVNKVEVYVVLESVRSIALALNVADWYP